MSVVSDLAEWLEVDGLGGFASGTTAGIRTRRYHAILLTATNPPSERKILVNGCEAWVETTHGQLVPDFTPLRAGCRLPERNNPIKNFELRPWPKWQF